MTSQLRVEATIDAPAHRIFALLADPSRHTEIDGSGMLRGQLDAAGPVTAVGDEFRMDMHQDHLGGYEMTNLVVAFEPDVRIGWQPRMHRAPESAPHMAGQGPRGQTYTYELAPDGDRTVVTQVYDWSGVTDPALLARMPRVTREQLQDTLTRLAAAVRDRSVGPAAR